MRNRLLATGLVLAAAAGFAGSQVTTSHAASFPTLSTSSRNEVLVSPKCYREVQKTTTYYRYSTKAGGYVRYVAPKVTITYSTHCHA